MSEAGAGTVHTTCPYCGVGCGVLATQQADGRIEIAGDPEHPANLGRLCGKGMALAETLSLDDRLLTPQIGGRAAGWDEALDLIASRFSETVAEYGPDAVAFYVSGQLLTEDYYVANKLMKGFIGSGNIDTNSRLCMASSVAGHRRAFGADTVPVSYEDLEAADLVVLVGSNLAWCHPVLYQRLAAAKARRPGMRVVLIDPRRTASAEIADLHLAIHSDADIALFVGLLGHLADSGRLDQGYIARHTTGFEQALWAAAALDISQIAHLTGIDPRTLTRFYRMFAETQRVVTVYSQGVNQSVCGTDKVGAIINCHLATGRIGRPGMGPFSVTGQPNAMGGREVGGLANMLAAHMEIENPQHRERVQRFWGAPHIADKPGLKAIDMFRAMGEGRIKALWIMATNPVDSMPDADDVAAALGACPFVVVSDVAASTDTLRHAHVRLPAAAWGEKDGTVTNSERRISRQRAFLPAPGDARPDWWIVCEVARRMGFADAFNYAGPAAIFAEHAALSAFENQGTRDFDIGICAGVDAATYDAMLPLQWPAPADRQGRSRFFADGGFYTPDGRARFMPISAEDRPANPEAFPMTLNTGRVRDHWHTMTRSGRSPKLSQHTAEPFAELNPGDAARWGVGEAEILRVATSRGDVLVRALISDRQLSGTVFVPMHWNDQFAARARVDSMVAALTDPHSGQPALKRTAARIERFAAATYGFAVTRRKPTNLTADYWAVARCPGGWRIELAFAEPQDGRELTAALFPTAIDAQTLSYADRHARRYRFARFARGQLLGALYLSADPVAVSRSWAVEQLAAECSTAQARLTVLAGRAGRGQPDRGALVCSCYGVGANQIAAAVRAGCATPDEIGTELQAGTGCGSCRGEIKAIIDACRFQAAE
ncbi:MAG: molybdopterin-dependent oxidoreductase [Alphaproteobacteria bacterium]